MAFPPDPATFVAIASALTALTGLLRELRNWIESWHKPPHDNRAEILTDASQAVSPGSIDMLCRPEVSKITITTRAPV